MSFKPSNTQSDMIPNFVKGSKKIIGAALNYKDALLKAKAAKPDNPVLFLKPSSSYISEGQDIKVPTVFKEIYHEIELGVIIGKPCKNVSPEEAMNYVQGYCLALDLTAMCELGVARSKGFPWSLGKGFDTSTPVSRFVSLDELKNPEDVRIWCKVNGVMKQDNSTKDLVFTIPELISFSSKYMTLETNDLILTGTPNGVDSLKDGDVIECGLGSLLEMKFNVKNE